MGIFDRFRGRNRVDDVEEARRLAEIENEARKRREEDQARDEQKRQSSVTGRLENLRKTKNKAMGAVEDVFVQKAINLTVKVGTSARFWGVMALILIFVVPFLWVTGYLQKILPYILPILIFLFFTILIISGFWLGIKHEDSTYFFIVFVFIIWIIDLIPAGIPFLGWLGPPYAGFKIDLSGILSTNWAAVITSSYIFIALIFGAFYDLAKKKPILFLLNFSLILALNQIVNYYNFLGLGSNFNVSYINYIFLGVTISAGVALFLLRKKWSGTELADYPTFLFMNLIFSFFWVNIGWISNTRALIHVIYILFFGFGYVARNEQENPAFWHIIIPALIIFDFYGYGLLWNYGLDVFRFIPVLVLFVLFYCYTRANNGYALVSLAFVLGIFLIFALQSFGVSASSIQFEAKNGVNYKDFYSQFKDKLTQIMEGQLDIATAGLYRGSVEKNRYESLGVYFSNIRASDPRFYQDEPITVWGTIRSKTYKDAVIINFSCSRLKDNKRIQADKAIPEIKFPIFQLEDVDTQCTFLPKDINDPKAVSIGPNTVTLSAEYNFATDSYLKTYFMDRDRFKSYSRESIDPLADLGITDKNPGTVYTNGPVEIGLGAGPLVPVSSDYAIKPTIGITLTNRQEIQDKDKNIIQKWDGKIKNITELVLLVPPGIKLDNLESCQLPKNDPQRLECPCNFPFKEYTRGDCQTSCSANVLNPCRDACYNVYSKDANGRDSCVNDCATTANNCNTECDNLFNAAKDEGTGKYNGYALDVGSLELKDLNKDIDKHRTFVCRYTPGTDVLDTTPITTRYFRARARYVYLAENSVAVNVDKPPVDVVGIEPYIDVPQPERFYGLIPQPIPYTPSHTDLDTYFTSKGSELAGIGQCIKDVESETKVPVLVILSIANLESDKSGGKWSQLSGLAKLSNALFGIKCTNDYKNKYCTFEDKTQCCRGYSKTTKDVIYEPTAPNVYNAYPNYCESVKDFGRTISTLPIYRTAMQYTQDPEQMIRKIGEAGYASDTNWANLVIGRMNIIKNDVQQSASVIT